MKSEKIKPKKSLGQNFLHDHQILKKIADAAQITPTDTVVEIGPGQGALTEFLVQSALKVLAIEKDDRLIDFLQTKFAKLTQNKLHIVSADALDFDPATFGLQNQKYVLVGNIPYYLTGALFKKFLTASLAPKSLTFVVQREVAERILARDGKESILSISVKAFGTPEFGGVIKAGSFNPVPKVDSAILSIRHVSQVKFQEFKIQAADFFKILKAGFAHKRKLLASNLSLHYPSTEIRAALEKIGLNERVRAENLQTEDWLKLTKELE